MFTPALRAGSSLRFVETKINKSKKLIKVISKAPLFAVRVANSIIDVRVREEVKTEI